MSAEILRRAAALMRERAERLAPGPWVPFKYIVGGGENNGDIASTWPDPDGIYAEHIASWHPAVALAVAAWLDNVAAPFDQMWEADEDGILWGYDLDGDPLRFDESQDSLALAVARAYLGGDA